MEEDSGGGDMYSQPNQYHSTSNPAPHSTFYYQQSHAKIRGEEAKSNPRQNHVQYDNNRRSVSPSPMLPNSNDNSNIINKQFNHQTASSSHPVNSQQHQLKLPYHISQSSSFKSNHLQVANHHEVGTDLDITRYDKNQHNDSFVPINEDNIDNFDNSFDHEPIAKIDLSLANASDDHSHREQQQLHQNEGPEEENINTEEIIEAIFNMEWQIERGEVDLKVLRQMLQDADHRFLMMKRIVIYMYHDQVMIYGARSLFIFRGDNIIRKMCAWLIDWDPFEYFVLLIIALNSVVLAIYDYQDRDSRTEYNQVLDVIGLVFTGIFIFEAVTVIIAKGFILRRDSYLRSGWGILDFIVVVSGLIELFMSKVKLKSLRVLRALRPLKSITAIPSMRKLVTALIQTLPDFGNVGIFLVYVFILFAIMGVHLYNGVTYNQCRLSSQPVNSSYWPIDTTINRMCTQQGTGLFQCPSGDECGNPEDFELEFDKMDYINNGYMYYGIHNFDNLFNSLQVVFQIVTTDLWTTYMYNLMDVDSPFLAATFTILIVVIGSFFLMNLILTVIIQTFINITKNELVEEVRRLNELAMAKMTTLQMIKNNNNNNGGGGNQSPEEQKAAEQLHAKISQVYGGSPINNASRAPSVVGVAPEVVSPSFQLQVMQQNQDSLRNLLGGGGGLKTMKTQAFHNNRLAPQAQQVAALQHHQSQGTLLPNPLDSATRGGPKPSRNDDYDDDDEADSQMTYLKDRVRQKNVVNVFSKTVTQREGPPRKRPLPPSPSQDKVISSIANQCGGNQDSNKKLQSYLTEKLDQDQRKMSLYNKIINDSDTKRNNANAVSIIGGGTGKNQAAVPLGSSIKIVDEKEFQAETIRDITNMKVRLSLKRQEGSLSRHVVRFEIEQRAENSDLYKFFFRIQQSNLFVIAISIAIVANTVFLSLDKYPTDQDTNWLVDKVNIGFTLLFLLEMIIKLIGLGFKGYFFDRYNIFDSLIVIGSIIDLIISLSLKSDTNGLITAFRSVRLLRLFKLAKSWKRLDYLLKTMSRAIKDVATFSVLMTIFLFTFALFGMELFAHKTKFNSSDLVDLSDQGISPSNNFDNLLQAFTSVFVVLTGDWWSTIYFAHYRANPSIVTTFYFILLILIGQKVLLNLFLAILLQNFDENNMREYMQKEMKNNNFDRKKTLGQQHIMELVNRLKKRVTRQVKKCKIICNGSKKKKQSRGTSNDKLNQTSIVISNKSAQQDERKDTLLQTETIFIVEGKSLGIFNHNNPLRLFVIQLVNSKWFECFIMLTILVSSIQLALDRPLEDPKSSYKKAIDIIDLATTAIFLFEAALKIVAYGLIMNGRQSYLRKMWNVTDISILFLSVLSLSPAIGDLQIFKMFRILRVLRLVSRDERLKVVIKSLMHAAPSILNVTIVLMFFLMIFGIMCVSYFKGKFYSCSTGHLGYQVLSNNDYSSLPYAVVQNKWDCLTTGGDWVNQDSNFDNLLEAIFMLFIMSTGTWSDFMYLTASVTKIDDVQVRLNSPFWLFFFIFYIILAQFFLMNLFVGVVVSTFNSEADKQCGNNLLTDKQKEWIDARVLVLRSQPLRKLRPPENGFRRVFYLIQTSKRYERFIIGCIIMNTIALAFKWYMQPAWIEKASELLNYIFIAIFSCEAIIKMVALGVKSYFSESWTKFDFVILLGSYAGIFLSLFSTLTIKGAITIIRAFRILRIVRLIKSARSLNIMFTTFIVSLPALLNVGGLLLLILYLYSILGMELFGDVMRNGKFNDSMNFETFSNAFFTLCAVATSDSWNLITYSAVRPYSPTFQCKYEPTYEDYLANGNQPIGCGTGKWGVLFFFSLNLFVCQIFLKLFVAIILQAFLDTQVKDERLFNHTMLAHFRNVWCEFDPDATGFISIGVFRDFLKDLGRPLGFDQLQLESRAQQDKFIAALKLPTYDRMSNFQFLDVLNALSLRLMVIDHSNQQKARRANTLRQQQIREMEKNNKNSSDLENREDGSDSEQSNIEEDMPEYVNTEQEQEDIRVKIEQDIHKLLLKDESGGIVVFKELKEKEQQQLTSSHLVAKRDTEFTSEHVAAAQWAVSKMKRFLRIRRKQRALVAEASPLQDEPEAIANDSYKNIGETSESPIGRPRGPGSNAIPVVEVHDAEDEELPRKLILDVSEANDCNLKIQSQNISRQSDELIVYDENQAPSNLQSNTNPNDYQSLFCPDQGLDSSSGRLLNSLAINNQQTAAFRELQYQNIQNQDPPAANPIVKRGSIISEAEDDQVIIGSDVKRIAAPAAAGVGRRLTTGERGGIVDNSSQGAGGNGLLNDSPLEEEDKEDFHHPIPSDDLNDMSNDPRRHLRSQMNRNFYHLHNDSLSSFAPTSTQNPLWVNARLLEFRQGRYTTANLSGGLHTPMNADQHLIPLFNPDDHQGGNQDQQHQQRREPLMLLLEVDNMVYFNPTSSPDQHLKNDQEELGAIRQQPFSHQSQTTLHITQNIPTTQSDGHHLQHSNKTKSQTSLHHQGRRNSQQ